MRPSRSPQITLAQRLAAAEDAVARLDERLATSPIAAAFCARTHALDATAAVFLEGELVSLEDLVLHDAAADAHAPTLAITRAHRILRGRRRIAAAAAGWATSASGLDALRGTAVAAETTPCPVPRDAIVDEEDAFAAELADIDALIARAGRTLAGRPPQDSSLQDISLQASSPQAETPSGREDRLKTWRQIIERTHDDPPVLAAARAVAAFEDLAPLPNDAWLGRLVAADLLRARGKTRHHLAALNLGQKLVRREAAGRRPHDDATRLTAAVAMISRAAEAGLADHDRWRTLRRQLEGKLVGRRSTSNLPALIDLVMRAPVVSSQTIADELKISTRAAQTLVATLGLRELTGRSRYRCWGIL